MAARWNGTPWRFQSLSELINPTKAASFCPRETEHDGIPLYGPGQVYVNSSSPRQVVGPAKRLQCSGGVGARLDYPREEATADTQLLIEFNDVGDGSSLPQAVLWAIARNKLQIELYNCLVMEDFTRARLFQQALLFFIDVSHQDRLLNRQDQVRLFTYLGDHLESLSDGLRGEDEARANDYLALASRFRRVASSH